MHPDKWAQFRGYYLEPTARIDALSTTALIQLHRIIVEYNRREGQKNDR